MLSLIQIPNALTLSERFYIYHSANPLFIRQHAQLIMSANEMFVCTIRGTQHLVPFVFFFSSLSTGHIPSSLGVILRTTDKIVWANEFERKLLQNHSNLTLTYLAKVAFLFLIWDACSWSHAALCFLHSHRADLFNRVHLNKQPEDWVEKD